MEILISFRTTRILPPDPIVTGHAGAVVEFQGNVRGEEKGQAISALRYEIYEPMAEQAMRDILEELAREHPCQSVHVIHRYGIVPVGEAAIWVRIASRHRTEGIRMLENFMHRLNRMFRSGRRR